MKIIVIGNGGSGKTWLGKRLAQLLPASMIHLDHLFWEPGGFDKKRSDREVNSLIEQSKTASSWIAEGVFGELAQQFVPDADALIWLDLDWEQCKRRLENRGSESKAHMERVQSDAGLAKLITWASNYYSRADMRSFIGHKQMFNEFDGIQVRMRDEGAVNDFVADFQLNTPADALARAAEL